MDFGLLEVPDILQLLVQLDYMRPTWPRDFSFTVIYMLEKVRNLRLRIHETTPINEDRAPFDVDEFFMPDEDAAYYDRDYPVSYTHLTLPTTPYV